MINKWDVFYCSLDPAQGSEQRGKRPVLVVSNDAVNHNLTVSTVLPFSSVKQGARIYPSEIVVPAPASGLALNSVVMVQQIRTVSHKRLVEKVGGVSDADIRAKILAALRDYFEI